MQIRKTLFPEGIQGVQSRKSISSPDRERNDMTWADWIKHGLDLIQRESKTSQGRKNVELISEFLSRFCNLGSIPGLLSGSEEDQRRQNDAHQLSENEHKQ